MRWATCFHQFDGARMQFAGFAVQEEGDRHAPVALARDAPVGTVGDHRVQARLAPGREEFGGFDAAEASSRRLGPPSGVRSMPTNHWAVAR